MERVPGNNYCQRAGGWCESDNYPGEGGSRAAGGKPLTLAASKACKIEWAAIRRPNRVEPREYASRPWLLPGREVYVFNWYSGFNSQNSVVIELELRPKFILTPDYYFSKEVG